jgi:membrane fusion protein (multidrug efflux system)
MRLVSQIIVVGVIAGIGYGGWQYRAQLPWVGDLVGDLMGAKDGAKEKKRRGGRPTLVEVKKAHTGTVTVSVEAVGTSLANESISVTAKVTALVGGINFREGQWVKKGAVLLTLDASELRAELAEKKAARDNARRLYERARKLARNRNVPTARVEDLFGSLALAEARVRTDEAALGAYVVRAPFSGRLGLRRISVGALVRPGTEITTLDDTSKIKVDFRVPETALSLISKGQIVKASSAAYPGRQFSGLVETIDSRVDPVTRSIVIRAIFENRKGLLRPGMFLAARLTSAVRENAVLIAEEALIANKDELYVFAVRDGKAIRTVVTTGEQILGSIEIRTGIEAGTPVIVGGVQKVRHGGAVKIVPPGGFKKGGRESAKQPTDEARDGQKPGAKKPVDAAS